jgi:hypothetical protein
MGLHLETIQVELQRISIANIQLQVKGILNQAMESL